MVSVEGYKIVNLFVEKVRFTCHFAGFSLQNHQPVSCGKDGHWSELVNGDLTSFISPFNSPVSGTTVTESTTTLSAAPVFRQLHCNVSKSSVQSELRTFLRWIQWFWLFFPLFCQSAWRRPTTAENRVLAEPIRSWWQAAGWCPGWWIVWPCSPLSSNFPRQG